MVFASQRPHSTLFWPGRGQAHKTWVWWSLPLVIPRDEGIRVINSVRTGSSAGGWWLARYTHTFWLQKPQSKIFPPPPPWSPTKVFPWAGGIPGLPFLKRLSQEVIPHPPLLHPTPGSSFLSFSSERSLWAMQKHPEATPQDHYNCLSDELWALFGFIQRNSRKLNPQQIKRARWYLGTGLNFDMHVFNSILHQRTPLNTKIQCHAWHPSTGLDFKDPVQVTLTQTLVVSTLTLQSFVVVVAKTIFNHTTFTSALC